MHTSHPTLKEAYSACSLARFLTSDGHGGQAAPPLSAKPFHADGTDGEIMPPVLAKGWFLHEPASEVAWQWPSTYAINFLLMQMLDIGSGMGRAPANVSCCAGADFAAQARCRELLRWCAQVYIPTTPPSMVGTNFLIVNPGISGGFKG